MTLRHMVADIVAKDGSGTVVSVHAQVAEHGFSEMQVTQALANAKRVGTVMTRGRKVRDQRQMYYPTSSAMEQMAKRLSRRIPVVSSVFELGNPTTELPDPPAVRKINTPLGPWNSEGA
jgi:hypothetical protein